MTRTQPPQPTSLRHRANAALRDRAVLWEGQRRDELFERSRKHPRIYLTAPQKRHLHQLTAHLSANKDWPPKITREPTARLEALDAMFDEDGPLVLLTVSLDTLNALPLKSQELKELAVSIIDCALEELAHPRAPHTASIQRGICGGTHVHLGIPLGHLRPEYADLICAARHGPGGGCLLRDGEAHGVLMLDPPENREKLAWYLARDPDARLDEPNDGIYLDALEEELTRKASGHRSPRLGWTRGVRR